MGKPTKCIPQNPFLSYWTTKPPTTTSTTLPPENLNAYVRIPSSGLACPPNFLSNTTTTTTSTTTTLPPLVASNNINNCRLYQVDVFPDTVDYNFICSDYETYQNQSAVVRYQPCGSYNFVDQMFYNDRYVCVVEDNIRLLTGNGQVNFISNNCILTTSE